MNLKVTARYKTSLLLRPQKLEVLLSAIVPQFLQLFYGWSILGLLFLNFRRFNAIGRATNSATAISHLLPTIRESRWPHR